MIPNENIRETNRNMIVSSETPNCETVSLYIHIPFCASKCHYCDFNSYAGMEAWVPSYIKALNREIETLGRTHLVQIYSIFIGGGTPSVIEPEYLSSILETISKHMQVKAGCEITMEANPGTLSFEKLYAYKQMGINRLSIGLQAWQDPLLKSMGRIHTKAQFVENVSNAEKAGFENISVDLMFGLPEQTMHDWQETLFQVTSLSESIKHVSCYGLKLEEGTGWYKRSIKGELPVVDDKLERDMYHYAVEYLKRRGIHQYEISNFSLNGYESKHNLVYWTLKPYIGLGAGAHSFDGIRRFSNVASIKDYIHLMEGEGVTVEADDACSSVTNEWYSKALDKASVTELTLEDRVTEYIFLGLRLNQGIHLKVIHERFGIHAQLKYQNQIQKLISQGLIEADGSCIRLTPKGFDFANLVFVEFV